MTRYRRYENLTLRVSLIEYPPLTMYARNKDETQSLYGTFASPFSNATAALGIRLKLQNASNMEYGYIRSDGVPTGSLHDIHTEIADVAIGPHPVNNFGFPNSKLQRFVPNKIAGGLDRVYDIGQSNDASMLFKIVLSLLILATILGSIANLLEIFSINFVNAPKSFRCKNLIFNFIKAGFVETTKHIQIESTKIIFVFWLLGCVVFTNLYTANMRMASVVLTPVKRFQSAGDVLKDPKLLPIYITTTGNGLMIYGDSKVKQVHERALEMNSMLEDPNDYYLESTLKILTSRKGILVLPEIALIYMLSTICSRSNGYFYLGKEPIIALPATLYYRSTFDRELLKQIDYRLRWLQESGFEEERWFPKGEMNTDKHRCFASAESTSTKLLDEYKALNVNQIAAIFLVCGTLSGVAVLVLILEIAIDRYQSRTRAENVKIFDRGVRS